MQLWFAHDAGVTMREQLVTQIVLGILCGDLAPGERLPSTREIARRFRLHPNTASAGYRQLERDRWVEFRRGSGVYVRESKHNAKLSAALALDQHIASFFRTARKLGLPLGEIRARLRHYLEMQPPDHFLLIEPDEELRRIVAAEVQRAVKLPVQTTGLKACGRPESINGAAPVVLTNRLRAAEQTLPKGVEILTLRVRSVPASLAEWLPAPTGALIAIASSWAGFLSMARTVLVAAGFDEDSLLFRDSRKANWQRGLKQAAAVACDMVTAAKLPRNLRVIVFPLVAESSINELRQYEEFIANPY